MLELASRLNIPPNACEELVPALRNWREILAEHEVDTHMWFLFGSIVKQTPKDIYSENPMMFLAQELIGARGPATHNFRAESDIDAGAVVSDGQDEVDLQTYNPRSPFKTTKVGEHVLSLTRFTASWMERRNVPTSAAQSDESIDLGIYGQIIVVQL